MAKRDVMATATGWKPAMQWLIFLRSGLARQTRTARSYEEAKRVAREALADGSWADAWIMEARRPL